VENLEPNNNHNPQKRMHTANLGNPKLFASFVEEGKNDRDDGEIEVYIEDIKDEGEGQDGVS
jgi:hypothetical protein